MGRSAPSTTSSRAGRGRAVPKSRKVPKEQVEEYLSRSLAAKRNKERFETFVERRVDERAGLLDAAGFGAGVTDMKMEEKKVSRIVGAERERATLEKVLAARRALLGE